MKTSVEWLKEYSEIDIDSVKLGDILTMTGSKVEGIEQKGNDIKKVVVGKILKIEKHQDSDHLVIAQASLPASHLFRTHNDSGRFHKLHIQRNR